MRVPTTTSDYGSSSSSPPDASFEIVEPNAVYHHDPIEVELLTAADWQHLASLGPVEMKSCSSGRLISPRLVYRVKGLYPECTYGFGLTMVKMSGELIAWRDRFVEKQTKQTMSAEEEVMDELYSAPKKGSHWMRTGVDLSMIKIYTLGRRTARLPSGKEKATCLRVDFRTLYQPVLKVVQQMGDGTFHDVAQFQFDETLFVTVSTHDMRIKKPPTLRSMLLEQSQIVDRMVQQFRELDNILPLDLMDVQFDEEFNRVIPDNDIHQYALCFVQERPTDH